MKLKSLLCVATLACFVLSASNVAAVDWLGGGGDDLWTTPANWDGGVAPVAGDFARFPTDNSTTIIQSPMNIDIAAFELGHPGPNDPFANSASSVINMTGGNLTALTNLSNIGRGVNTDPNHLVQFNMSGGTMDLRGVSIPEAFNPAGQPGACALCLPQTAEFHVSGNSVVNTDFIRLGANDSVSTMTISDNAQVNILARAINGFTNGSLAIENWFQGVVGDDGPVNSLLDIRDNAVLKVHGIHFVGRSNDTNAAVGDIATQEEFDYYVAEYIGNNVMVANGGANLVDASFADGVMTFRVGAVVPEPTSLCLVALGVGMLATRRKR